MKIVVEIPEDNKLYLLKTTLLLSYIESFGLNDKLKKELIAAVNLKLTKNGAEDIL